jgi:hypothetical protein
MLVFLSRFVARLPLRWAQSVGALAGRLAMALSSGFRRKSSENLALAGLLDPARLRRTAEEVGRAAAETPFVWFAPHDRVEALSEALLGATGLAPRQIEQAKAALGKRMTVLLGTADTNRDDPDLRKTPEADAQGPHRFARGQAFFAQGQQAAAARNVATSK